MRYSVFICFLLAIFNSDALTVKSMSHTDWSNPVTWSTGQVPTNPDTILIGHYVTINSDLTISPPTVLKVENTGTLCGDYLLNVSCGSEWINYGSVFVNRFIVRKGVNYCTITTRGTNTVTGCPTGSWMVVPPKGNLNMVSWSACKAVDTNWDNIIPVFGGCTVGIKEEFLAEMFLYPNPVNDKLYIKFPHDKEGSVKIKDVAGRIVKQESKELNESEIVFSDLLCGIYFAEINTGNNTFIKKIIKN